MLSGSHTYFWEQIQDGVDEGTGLPSMPTTGIGQDWTAVGDLPMEH
jgi:hypothetical protein